MELTRSEAQEIIGGGTSDQEPADICDLSFREAEEHEVFLCGCAVDHDSQHRPIICGNIAELIAPVERGGKKMVAGLCKKHGRRLPEERLN